MTQRFLAILTVRNESAFLLEWLAHHRACGFTDFLVFANDCQDGTDAMLARLQDMGWLTYLPNNAQDAGALAAKGAQWSALVRAQAHPLMAAADWVMTLDVDEFVNIHAGHHQLSCLLKALPHATALPMTWRFFGNAGVQHFTHSPITQTFRQAAPRVLHWPWRAAMFKTLFRNDGRYRKLGVHRPRARDQSAPPPVWVDGAGRELAPRFHDAGLISPFGRDNYTLFQLNHYALGAMESYVLKADRGRANRSGAPFDMSYWIERNFNQEADHSIDALAPARAQLLADLISDPVLADLHAHGLAWRHARFETLMLQEPFRDLYGRLLMTEPTRALPLAQAQLLVQYAQKAAAQSNE